MKNQPKVLITDRYSAESVARLKSELNCDVKTSKDFAPTTEELKDAEILLIRSRTTIDEKLLEKAPALKLIVSATAGFDHIDFHAAAKRDIKVAHTPGANTESAAQLTLLLLLTARRNFAATMANTAQNKWKDSLPLAHEIGNQVLGLLGFGKVGQRVAELAAPLKLKIIAYDPYQEEEAFERLQVERVGLTELLVQSDFLSLHTPLTTETYHILRLSTIEAMPDHAWIINTSRGAVISEAELILALEQGLIAGAALDVFETEPLTKDSKLRQMPNVIITPHIGAFTEEAFLKASHAAIDKVGEFLRTRSVSDALPPPTEWAKYLRRE